LATISSTVCPGWTLSSANRFRARSNAKSPRPVRSFHGPPGRYTPAGLVPGAETKSTFGTKTRWVCSSRKRITFGTMK
jgi:hypothetical protein